MFVCIFMIMIGKVSIHYSGFALDSNGVLYIGKDSKIEKYKGTEVVGEISPQTSRGYAFTIQSDTIILSTASTVYTLDTNGNVLDKKVDINTETFNDLQKQKNSFEAQDGHTYKMKNIFGRVQVVSENGSVIYKMPLPDYVAKLAFILTLVSVFITVPILIIKFKR